MKRISFFIITLFLSAARGATVQPEDTGEALVNPGMGWTMHFYSNIPKNYGSKLAPSDTLDETAASNLRLGHRVTVWTPSGYPCP